MRAEGRDEFDVVRVRVCCVGLLICSVFLEPVALQCSQRQQQQVFNETERVIPDTIRRLQKAVDDLVEFVVSSTDKIGSLSCAIIQQTAIACPRADNRPGKQSRR